MHIADKLQFIINLKSIGYNRVKKIFINEIDFKELYDYLPLVKKNYTSSNPHLEYINLYFSGFEICLSKEAKKLPDNKEDLEFWAGYRMKWISVKEKLPEKQMILCNCKDGYELGYYGRYGQEQWHNTLGTDTLQVTHWMPLPEPPKEEE